MKRYAALPVLFLLLFAASTALAAKAPAVEALGKEAAACHLVAHLQAYTDGWDGVSPAFSAEDGCEDYGHVHCYGRRVSLWDTPRKGDHRVPFYAGTMDGRIGPDTQFQLVDVVLYKGTFYANIRIYEGDYIGCDCVTIDRFEPVPIYDSFEDFTLP